MKERPVTRIEVLALESGAHGLPPHVQLKVTWIPSETQHIMALRPGDTATVNAQWDKAPEPGELPSSAKLFRYSVQFSLLRKS